MFKSPIRKTALLPVLAALCAVTLALVSPTALHAQLAGQGQITGRVTDSTGAVIRHATVTITNKGTGVQMVRSTSASGIYLASPLTPGIYKVAVQDNGFTTAVQDNITVNGTQSVGLDIKLQVGAQAQTITVSSAPPALDTTDATLGATMEQKTYAALPILVNDGQRDPTAFSKLMPGVQGGARAGTLSGQGGSGSRVVQNYIDGVPATPPSETDDNRSVQLGIPMDAVDQFSVVTSGASAQYQGMGSESYNIKSGTNQFHGQVQAFFRNTAFDSWAYFAKAATTKTLVNGVPKTVPAPKPGEHQDELDFTVGGPVVIPHVYNGHNKLFFFASYSKYHETKGVNPSFVSIPTTLERQGNFTELNYPIYDPTTYTACTNKNGGIPCVYQFDGAWNGVATPNVIPAGEISPLAKYMQKFMPDPTIAGTQNNLLTGEPFGLNNWSLAARVDFHPNAKHDISIMNTSGVRNFLGFDAASGAPPPYNRGFYVTENFATTVLNDTWIISPSVVNSMSYGYIRSWIPVVNATLGVKQYNPVTGIGIGGLQPGQQSEAFPSVSFGGFADNPTTWYGSNSSYTQNTNTYDFVDNLQWTKGKHNITIGFVFQWRNENQDAWDSPTKPLGLSMSNLSTAGFANGKIQNATTGNSYASFMLGAVNTTGFAVQPFTTLGARYKGIAPTFEDDWRVSPSLTLNLGARWDINTPYHEVKNRWAYMNPHLTNPITGTLGAIEYVGYGPYSCGCRNPYGTYLGNFEPRIGFADAIGTKTVIRGAFSVMSSLGGGVGGAGNANNGSGQTGMVGSVFYANSVQGEQPAYYLNNSADFGTMGIANTSLPGFTPTNSPTPNITPGVNTGNYVTASGVGVSPQGIGTLEPESANRSPYSETWNIGVQRSIFPNTVISVNYVGSESHFIVGSNNGFLQNEIDPKYEALGALLKQYPNGVDKNGQTYLQEAQAIDPSLQLPYANFGGKSATIAAMLSPFPQYGGISDVYNNTGSAAYKAMQLNLTQNTWRGLNFQLNYTYSQEKDSSKCCRTGYDIPGSAITDGIARAQKTLDYSEHNPRHILHAFGTYALPFGKGHIGGTNPVVNLLASNWQTSGIYSYSSGALLGFGASGCVAVGVGCNPSFTPGYTKTPRINGGYGHGLNALTSATTPFLDAGAFFVTNKTYQVGNVPATGGYNVFGPSRWEIDGGLSRTFKIKDNMAFVFAAQVQNLTNHFSWGGPNTTINKVVNNAGPNGNGLGTNTASSFGTVGNSGQGPRDWQFNGRITF